MADTKGKIVRFYISRAENGWLISIDYDASSWVTRTDEEMVEMIAILLGIAPPNLPSRIWQWAGRLLREE